MAMQGAHKSHMLKRFKCLTEGLTHQGNPTLLREIYTDLYITQGGRGKVNDEHEVRHIERASWREAAQDGPIKCSDLFDHLDKESTSLCEKGKPIRLVLTKGVAGIGKTVSVQKLILDWAEGRSNQDVDFIFPLPFRELNIMKEKTISLVDLIKHFFSDVKDPSVFTSLENKVMFIFDGLDECRLPLNFSSNPECFDVTEPVPLHVLLTNLIKGNLIPSALLWITTRPAAANLIPLECVNQVTEIRGFNDPQKEEYFRKNISDESLASRTIKHLKSSRSLYIMCHIPVFSWISATVVERTSDGSGSLKMPRTLTQMYTHFLIVQIRIKNTKYTEPEERDEEIIFKLGKLAFQQLEKGNLIFYEGDLRECGIDITEASVYSGVCTEIFREEAGMYQGKVFSFVHLSIQEFLAALYVFLCFNSRQRKISGHHQTPCLASLVRAATLHDLHKTAMDLALQSRNGHLDLFLRFLLGLSLESNQSLLRHLLPQTNSQSQSSEETMQLLKQKIRLQSEEDRRINLFYCLNELNQHAVVERIQRSSGTLTVEMLLPGQWKTGKFTFKTSEEYMDGFDLQKYIKTPEMDQTDLLSPEDVLWKLMPSDVFTSSTSAELESCSLSEKSCSYLASALTSHSSHLTQLLLKDPYRLSPSSLTLSVGCQEHSSRLKKLQLKDTDRSPSLTVSSSAGCHPNCKPWELRLERRDVTEEICSYLVSLLTSHTSTIYGYHLEEEEEEGERLCSTLSHQDCRLEKLQLEFCPLSEKSCSHLASALTSLSSRLTQLELKNNNYMLQDSAVELLCSSLCHNNCKLEKLQLERCPLSEKSCSYLASALTSHSSRLTQLHLGHNDMQDSAVELLCSALWHTNCRLETVQLDGCPLSERSCSHLASALTSYSSRLTQLELNNNNNKLQDSAVDFLCSALSDLNCKLQKLQLERCPLSENSYSYLVSALTSLSSGLTQLTLKNVFIPDKSAAEKLTALQNDPHYQVEIRWYHDHYDPTKRLLDLSCRVLEDSEVTTPSAHRQQQSQEKGRICQTCADIQDPGHWCVMLPSISLESGECVYTVSAAAGSYECSESGLRWSCAGPVTLQYCISNEELFWAQLQMLGYRPAGPLLEIKLLSGELEEVHLPHSLCLGGSDPVLLGEAVRALHGNDSGVSLETCELSRFHGRLSTQHFSLWQVVVRWLFPSSSSSSSVKDHCEVLIREHCPWPLVLHTYLLPSPSSARQWVENKGGRFIVKSSPVHSLCIDSTVQLHTSPDSLEITPSELTFTYRNPPTTFFEVYLENRLRNFKMTIKNAESRTVWEAVLRQGVDYLTEQDSTDSQNTPESQKGTPQQPSGIPGQMGSRMAAAFLEKTRPELVQRVTEVMPIADMLISKEVIGQETYANIHAAATSQDKMRLLFEGLRSAGAQGKLAFYTILQTQSPHLVEELWTAR